jgi:preprotein translocase subunit YajC
MFITPAFAQGSPGLSEGLQGLLPLLLMLPIFYFLLIKPQQDRMKRHREMVSNIRRGDSVVTAGGIIGKVIRVKDGEPEMEVEIAKDTIVRVIRGTVSEVRAKGEPVKETA